MVANEAASVRGGASTSSKQVGRAGAGRHGDDDSDAEGATPTPTDWTHVQLRDGRDGYVASRLLRPAGTPRPRASAPPPPKDAAGVAQLTETNQLKRKALDDEVAEAKNRGQRQRLRAVGRDQPRRPAGLRDAA